MTEQEIREIEEREQKATAFDEITLNRYALGGGRLASPADWITSLESGVRNLIADFYDEANREFYYHARADIPALIAALKAERTAHKRAVKALRRQYGVINTPRTLEGREYRGWCGICPGEWGKDQPEQHQPVMPDGLPCPAAPWKEGQ